MAHLFQQLLGRDDSLFTAALDKLEHMTGHDGVDTRLIADMTHEAHDIVRKLGLDSSHANAHEVYSALRSHVKKEGRTNELLVNDYLMYKFHDEVVSFNVLDILEDIRSDKYFSQRTLSHGKHALLGEITHRYTSHARTHDKTVRSLLVDDTHYGDKPTQIISLPSLAQVQSTI